MLSKSSIQNSPLSSAISTVNMNNQEPRADGLTLCAMIVRWYFALELDLDRWYCDRIEAGSCGVKKIDLPLLLVAIGRVILVDHQPVGVRHAGRSNAGRFWIDELAPRS